MNTVPDILKQAFTTVLIYSAYAAVIAAVVMAFRALLGKKLPAIISCALWGIVMLRLLLPVQLPAVFDLPQVPAISVQAPADSRQTPDIRINTDSSESLASQAVSAQPGQRASANADQTAASAITDDKNTFDVMSWLALVWAAGFLALVSRTIVYYLVSHKRLKAALPLNRSGFVSLCAGLAGMRYQDDIYMSDVCRVPVLFGLLRPKIILPVCAASMSDEALKHVVLHELAHKKRGDMGVMALWSLLLFVNWFNPMLWLADRLFARDMERACDETVIRILGPESKKAYAISLLKAALDANQKAGANEALAFVKGGVKHRIENVLNFKRTGKALTAVSMAIVLIMSAALLTACQPTPAIEPVIGRQEDALENIVAEQTPKALEDKTDVETEAPFVFEKIETPAHIAETHNDFEKLNLTIDADVTVPDVTAYPVTEVKKRVFSKNDILSFIKLLTGQNDELYSEWNLSKDEWLQKITKAKQQKYPGLFAEEWLNAMQGYYDAAPVTVENKSVNADVLLAEGKDSQIYVRDTNGRVSRFKAKTGDNLFCYTRVENQEICRASDYEGVDFSPNWDTKEHFNWCKPGEPDISQEDALAKVKKVLDAMQIDIELYTAEPCSIIVDSSDKTTGWQFVYTRAFSGLQMYDDTGGYSTVPEAMPSFIAPWPQEICTIAVDKEGVCFMYWRGASTVGSTVERSIRLEPFDTVQKSIVKQFGYFYGAINNGSDRKLNIDIFNIKLGISMIAVKDRPDTGLYIPTWYVSYYIESDESMLEQLMFSALDGSYIEPRMSSVK